MRFTPLLFIASTFLATSKAAPVPVSGSLNLYTRYDVESEQVFARAPVDNPEKDGGKKPRKKGSTTTPTTSDPPAMGSLQPPTNPSTGMGTGPGPVRSATTIGARQTGPYSQAGRKSRRSTVKTEPDSSGAGPSTQSQPTQSQKRRKQPETDTVQVPSQGHGGPLGGSQLSSFQSGSSGYFGSDHFQPFVPVQSQTYPPRPSTGNLDHNPPLSHIANIDFEHTPLQNVQRFPPIRRESSPPATSVQSSQSSMQPTQMGMSQPTPGNMPTSSQSSRMTRSQTRRQKQNAEPGDGGS